MHNCGGCSAGIGPSLLTSERFLVSPFLQVTRRPLAELFLGPSQVSFSYGRLLLTFLNGLGPRRGGLLELSQINQMGVLQRGPVDPRMSLSGKSTLVTQMRLSFIVRDDTSDPCLEILPFE